MRQVEHLARLPQACANDTCERSAPVRRGSSGRSSMVTSSGSEWTLTTALAPIRCRSTAGARFYHADGRVAACPSSRCPLSGTGRVSPAGIARGNGRIASIPDVAGSNPEIGHEPRSHSTRGCRAAAPGRRCLQTALRSAVTTPYRAASAGRSGFDAVSSIGNGLCGAVMLGQADVTQSRGEQAQLQASG
jgi:hypothetical protein